LLFANNVGTFLFQQGREAEAEPYLRRALAGRERIFGWENRDTLLTAGTMATILFQREKFAEAEALIKRVLAGSERALGPTHPETVGYRLYLANQYQRSGRPREAEPLYARILADGTGRLPDTDDTMIQAAAGLSVTRQVDNLLSGKPRADALTPARRMAAAIRERRTARGGRFGAAQAARELMSRGDHFMLLADALWDVDASDATTAEAFLALQDAVAGTTDRAVMQMALRRFADEQGAGLGALVREREELESRWAANSERQVQLLTIPDVEPAEREALRAEAATIEARLDQVEARLRRDFPDYLELANPRAITLENAFKVLQPDEALLLIVPGYRGTHVVAVTDSGLNWNISAWDRDKVSTAVRRLLWQLGGNVTPTAEEQAAWSRESVDAFDRATAHELYKQLIAPMSPLLAGKRHVFIAAAGALSSLPMGVLVTEAPQGSDSDPAALRSTKWLADAHALVQVPSVQSLLLLRRATAAGGRGGDRFIGFGDPVLQGGAAASGGRGATRGAAPDQPVFSGRLTRSGTPMADVRALRSMARLPGTAEELRNMRQALAAPPNSIFLGPQATEAQFRSMDLSDVSILALATHGLVAGEVDGAAEPGLVFTPPAEPSEEDDGFLTASEVAALRLNADWVILSACNTASGDGSEGATGLSGLARAFFYAGARAMLVSHWRVRDDVGAKLTVRTVELRREQPSLSRAEAFQRAMREIRNDQAQDAAASWAHPSAWAPFTLVGDAR
jgi:CHAT domain-containing protein